MEEQNKALENFSTYSSPINTIITKEANIESRFVKILKHLLLIFLQLITVFVTNLSLLVL